MSLCMICEDCTGRWVALRTGSTLQGNRVMYHFAADALNCPRCGSGGVINDDVAMEYQKHPDVVASWLGPRP